MKEELEQGKKKTQLSRKQGRKEGRREKLKWLEGRRERIKRKGKEENHMRKGVA